MIITSLVISSLPYTSWPPQAASIYNDLDWVEGRLHLFSFHYILLKLNVYLNET